MRGRTGGCSGGRGQVSSEAAAAAPLTMELPPSPSTGDQAQLAQARRSSVKRCLSPALASTTSCRPPANKRKVTDPGLLLVQVHSQDRGHSSLLRLWTMNFPELMLDMFK